MDKYILEKHNELFFCEDENSYLLFNSEINNWLHFDVIGKDIYESIRDSESIENAFKRLCEMYQVGIEDIQNDVSEFLEKLKENGFITDESTCVENKISAQEGKYPYNIMMLSVTNACNLKCMYCFNKDMREADSEQGNLDHLENIYLFLDKFKEEGGLGVTITGGEPFLYDKLACICKYAKKLGLRTDIISNATYLYAVKDLEEILDLLDNISLSIDSFNENVLRHLWGTNDISMSNIEKGLSRLNDYSKTKRKMNVAIKPIVSKINMDELEEVISKISGLLADCNVSFELTRYMTIGKKCDSDLGITDEEYVTAYINAYKNNRKESHQLYEMAITENGKYKPYPIKNTYICKPSFFIKPNGDVYPCQSLISRDYLLGNIHNDSFEVINERFGKIIQDKSIERLPKCRDCSFRYICPYKGGICQKDVHPDCKKKIIRSLCL